MHWKDWCWSWSSNTLATWCEDWLIGKEPDAGKDWGQAEKGTAEDEMVGWHHWVNGHEFEQAPEDSEGQGSLMCCSSWGRKKIGHNLQTNNNKNNLASDGKKRISETEPSSYWTIEMRTKTIIQIYNNNDFYDIVKHNRNIA